MGNYSLLFFPCLVGLITYAHDLSVSSLHLPKDKCNVFFIFVSPTLHSTRDFNFLFFLFSFLLLSLCSQMLSSMNSSFWGIIILECRCMEMLPKQTSWYQVRKHRLDHRKEWQVEHWLLVNECFSSLGAEVPEKAEKCLEGKVCSLEPPLEGFIGPLYFEGWVFRTAPDLQSVEVCRLPRPKGFLGRQGWGWQKLYSVLSL